MILTQQGQCHPVAVYLQIGDLNGDHVIVNSGNRFKIGQL
jgi:hypothetical protein